jgi:hypothetical protein
VATAATGFYRMLSEEMLQKERPRPCEPGPSTKPDGF